MGLKSSQLFGLPHFLIPSHHPAENSTLIYIYIFFFLIYNLFPHAYGIMGLNRCPKLMQLEVEKFLRPIETKNV